jgi:hypothetical protein
MAGFRNLLGSDAKAIHHDPGPEGESGEGDAAIVMLCLTYVAAFAIIVFGTPPPPAQKVIFRFLSSFASLASPRLVSSLLFRRSSRVLSPLRVPAPEGARRRLIPPRRVWFLPFSTFDS